MTPRRIQQQNERFPRNKYSYLAKEKKIHKIFHLTSLRQMKILIMNAFSLDLMKEIPHSAVVRMQFTDTCFLGFPSGRLLGLSLSLDNPNVSSNIS